MKAPSGVIGIDVGGANLKLAVWTDSTRPKCVSQRFPLWKAPDKLFSVVGHLIAELGKHQSVPDSLAVTMTGELADCFATRREGVACILRQLAFVVRAERISVYTVDGGWLTSEQAVQQPWKVAASNWHALANWLTRWPITKDMCHDAVIVDIGSTTTDVVPVEAGRLATTAQTDRQRLERGQLVYTGVSRTPICAIVQSLKLDNQSVPIMAELFATADDAYLTLGLVDSDPSDTATADGRPRTASYARARLARMLGEDSESLAENDIVQIAEQIIDAQAQRIAAAVEANLIAADRATEDRVTRPRIFFTGHGLPLFKRVCELIKTPHEVAALSGVLPPEASRCAPAVAVAWLKANQLSDDRSAAHHVDLPEAQSAVE